VSRTEILDGAPGRRRRPEAARGEEARWDPGPAAAAPAGPVPPRVVHMATVPETLGFLRGQLARLRRRGFECWAVASPGPSLEAFARREGAAARGLQMTRRITPVGDLVALARCVRLLLRIRPDIVHGHTPKGGLVAMIGAFLTRVPVRIYTVHGLPLETARGLRRVLLRGTERLSCLLAHRVQAVSPSLLRRIVDEGLCAAGKVRVLGEGTINGVDAEGRFAPSPGLDRAGAELRRRLGIPPEAPVIGFVGRIVRDKGVADLVAAWRRLRFERPDVHVLVVGAFEPQDALPREVERVLRFDPWIHLTGPVDSTPEFLAAMDVVALPSYREGFPQVPLEAAAMERPVVATRVTGCVDAIADGRTGTLVPPGDAEALAGALRRYLLDPELRRRHGREGRLRVLRHFRPERLWGEMEREYREALAARAASRPGRPPMPGGRSRRAGSPRRPALLVKRVLDLAAALLALAASAPLLALIALAIRFMEGPPVLFRQRRPGLRGRPFTLLKFRTMRPGPGTDEERMTPLGRFLRHSSLDEFPQLWNVVRGEMSLVGPRPLLMEYLRLYTPDQARRHEVRPGLTGWVQVNGRNGLTWPEKFELDLWYVDHWSLRLDLAILLRTAGRVLRRTGVEGPGSRCMPWPQEDLGRSSGTGARPRPLAGEGR